jgi:hypothetical protein
MMLNEWQGALIYPGGNPMQGEEDKISIKLNSFNLLLLHHGCLPTRRPGPISSMGIQRSSQPTHYPCLVLPVHQSPHLLDRRRHRRRALNPTPVCLLIQRKEHPPLPPEMDGDEENVGPFRRTSARTRRMVTRMASALASSDNRAQVMVG